MQTFDNFKRIRLIIAKLFEIQPLYHPLSQVTAMPLFEQSTTHLNCITYISNVVSCVKVFSHGFFLIYILINGAHQCYGFLLMKTLTADIHYVSILQL